MNEKFLYQKKIFKDRRKELRNNQTGAEKKLWDFLKQSKLGYKFTRQYSAGPYILDFFCPKLRLAIELDGAHHKEKESMIYDKDREEYLKSIDIKTMRFWNEIIIKNPDMAIKLIKEQISKMETPS